MKLARKLLPQSVKKKLRNHYYNQFKNNHIKQSEHIPKPNIKQQHIQNARLINSRINLLNTLPKNGVVAELGVDEGDFSHEIMKLCEPSKLYLVDFWGTDRYNETKKNLVYKRFENQMLDGKIEIKLGYSFDIAEDFEDSTFDWIYIDTDHSYETTRKELAAWAPKISPNGMICGHDYVMGNWNSLWKYGVIEAVHEFCIAENWEIIFLTTEMSPNPSFAIRRMASS